MCSLPWHCLLAKEAPRGLQVLSQPFTPLCCAEGGWISVVSLLQLGTHKTLLVAWSHGGIESHRSCPRSGEGGWEIRTCPVSSSLTGLPLAPRVPEHGGPGCQGQLRAAGPDPGAALGQREHRLLWGRSLEDHCLRLRHRCLLCQPAHPLPPL